MVVKRNIGGKITALLTHRELTPCPSGQSRRPGFSADAIFRFVLTDAQWAKIEPHCLGKPSYRGRSGGDNRRFVEAVLWVARIESPWRDLPELFGNWNTVFKRYRDWLKADVFIRFSMPARASRTWNTR